MQEKGIATYDQNTTVEAAAFSYRGTVKAENSENTSYITCSDKKLQDKKAVGGRQKETGDFLRLYGRCADRERGSHPKKVRSSHVSEAKETEYILPVSGNSKMKHRPVIIGSGPAGLFCGYLLAEQGYKPLIIERGRCVEERQKDVEKFWETNVLDIHSNVQFGEGGAGTFSDGKLNTLVKDVKGRNKKVLEIFIAHGAPESISYMNKPHIGTDILIRVVADMRRQIEQWGGTYLFETCVTDIEFENNHVTGVVCQKEPDGQPERILTDNVILAVGHSARDTFEMLLQKDVPMEAKSFAVGMRVEHPQSMISENQYGKEAAGKLPAASYKLTANLENGRGVYSFCMCPGGYVVNASSEENRLAVNGMSYSGRDGRNANSAIIVTVTPEDFEEAGPLSGVAFQRKLEERAFELGKGAVPQQLFGDFEQGKVSEDFGEFTTELKGTHTFGALHTLFPKEITRSFIQGMHQFAGRIPGFDRADTILSGVESRTSSPVKIPRDENFESSRKGLYPCGEGAGYAGGIMSAAMDGMKIAEEIIRRYAVPDTEEINRNERK